ncbi:hypothetical protein IMZ48_26345 [Candidatus Bathyarchaeota archaeon]|nr:hypothetical protein [Candidatus Bathyarchaeota archaeon]
MASYRELGTDCNEPILFAYELEILWCGLFVEYPGSLPETQFRGIAGFTNTNGRQPSQHLLDARGRGEGVSPGCKRKEQGWVIASFKRERKKQTRVPADNYAVATKKKATTWNSRFSTRVFQLAFFNVVSVETCSSEGQGTPRSNVVSTSYTVTPRDAT